MATDQTITTAEKQARCQGCCDDFYNHRDMGLNMVDGSPQCWNLKSAEVVRRFRLHWWTAPTVPGAYTEVETLSCYHQPGDFAYHKKLPDCAVDPQRL